MAIETSELKYQVIIKNDRSFYAHRLEEFLWINVNGKDVRYWVTVPGSVRSGLFVPSTDIEAVSVFSEDYISRNFDMIWTQDERFKNGDFLTDAENKHVFLYTKKEGETERVWLLSGGNATFQSSLSSRESTYGELKKIRRGWSDAHATFENMVDISK